jgi:hypothetical protein
LYIGFEVPLVLNTPLSLFNHYPLPSSGNSTHALWISSP